jgi:hypothetical protein
VHFCLEVTFWVEAINGFIVHFALSYLLDRAEINDSVVHTALRLPLGRTKSTIPSGTMNQQVQSDYDEPEVNMMSCGNHESLGHLTGVDGIGTNGNGEELMKSERKLAHMHCSNGVVTATRGTS